MTALATEALLPTATRLAGADIIHLTSAANGGNSRIYRVETPTRTYALKYYAPSPPGTRNRLEAEVAALRFFAKHSLPQVPAVYGSEDRFALYDWVEGSIPNDITRVDVDSAADFIARFPRLSQLPEAAAFGNAAEACLSLQELLTQIDRRLVRLREVAANESALHDFLESEIAPELGKCVSNARAAWSTQSWNPAEELPRREQCLIPGDFGFHNMLKMPDGKLTFIDFEYFGWDDPVKLVADTLLHPGYQLSPEALARLHTRFLGIFSTDPAFTVRLHAMLPLFSLRWALILCNEFLQEKRANRAFAASVAESDTAEWERRKQVQLGKAKAMLAHPALRLNTK